MGGLFPIKWFGKKSGLSAIRSGDVNMNIIRPLNSLGNMTVAVGTKNEFVYGDGNVQLTLTSLPAGSSGTLTVAETDGSPTVSGVSTIRFPDGSVTDAGGGTVDVTVSTANLTVEDADSSPSITNVTKIKFPDGSVTSGGTGIAIVDLSSSVSVSMYRLKAVGADTLTCRTWDGATEGGTDVTVAKNHKLRNSIASAVIDGVTVNYTYPTTTTRIASIGASSESQVVVPRYIVNDIVFVTSPSGGTGVSSVSKLDINADGRAWAKVP
jgi:hypothetical protein